jgi:hypothetical protein
MLFPELSFHELYDLKKSCTCLFPEKRFSEIDTDFLENLDTELLRRTYKKRIFDCHPDRLGAASESMIRFKTRESQQVNEAYERLKRFIHGRNEWIYTVLTSYNYHATYCSNGMDRPQSRHDRTDILERFKRHLPSFRGFFFKDMPGESARSM